MVTITNGIDKFVVTKGAYDETYKDLGFHLVDDDVEIAEKPAEPADSAQPERDVIEKPISQWTKAELKDYAVNNGISLEGKSVNEVRAIIKDHIDNSF